MYICVWEYAEMRKEVETTGPFRAAGVGDHIVLIMNTWEAPSAQTLYALEPLSV